MATHIYHKGMKISNMESVGRGTGARYLECIVGHDGSWIAKQWRRKAVECEILIDMAPRCQVCDQTAVRRAEYGDTLTVNLLGRIMCGACAWDADHGRKPYRPASRR